MPAASGSLPAFAPVMGGTVALLRGVFKLHQTEWLLEGKGHQADRWQSYRSSAHIDPGSPLRERLPNANQGVSCKWKWPLEPPPIILWNQLAYWWLVEPPECPLWVRLYCAPWNASHLLCYDPATGEAAVPFVHLLRFLFSG